MKHLSTLILQAQADLIQSAAQLGVIHSYKPDPDEDARGVRKSGRHRSRIHPARGGRSRRQAGRAAAKLESAKRGLAQAELDLRYCDITAEIDGVVTRRNVNPGNYVQICENLMAICSLNEIWLDAQFQGDASWRDLRIGQPVDLYVDMYGERTCVQGLAFPGFTIGTGSTLAQAAARERHWKFRQGGAAAAGPHRPAGLRSKQVTLAHRYGRSVPYVYINKPPTGVNAGKFLQSYLPQSAGTADVVGGPAVGK